MAVPKKKTSKGKRNQRHAHWKAKAGVAAAIARIRAEGWLAEGRLSLESSNAYVEQNGLPLVGLRRWDNVEY